VEWNLAEAKNRPRPVRRCVDRRRDRQRHALVPIGRKRRALASWVNGLETKFSDRMLAIDAETARVWGELTDLRARPNIQTRIDELAGKSNEGKLSPIEQAECRDIVEAIDFISILQAKARKRMPTAPDP
jgi:hypothetical protein